MSVEWVSMKHALSVIFGVLLVFLAGCGKGNFSESANAGKSRIFRYPIVTNPTTLDPGVVQDGDTIDLVQQVYEGLVAWGENNEAVPNLADSWDINDGGKTYVFHLKHGVKFQNGREMDANDFKFTFERNCDSSLINTAMAANYLSDIVGVNDKIAGKAKEVKGVQVVDKYTLKIMIDKPRAYFIDKLTYPVAYVIPKESVADLKPQEEIQVQNMIGTGPFKAVSFVPNQLFVLAAFKDYHGGAPLIDGIERPVISDDATRLNKFKAGELDLCQLERQDVAGLQADPKYKDELQFFRRPAIWYIGMNLKLYPPFANPKVRQAIAMAIDRKKIVDETLGGINEIANGILPPSVFGYREDGPTLPYDPAKARELLAEAGYPNGKGLPPLEMTFREQRPDIRLVAEAVAADLAKNLGMSNVSLKSEEWRSYLDKNNAKKQIFFHMRWEADYLDPQDFLSLLLTTDGAENKTYYSNPEVDALCAKADAMSDRAERTKLYQQAEDIVVKDAAWVPIYFQRDAELISPRVHGLRESVFGHLPHTTVKLDPIQ